MRETLESVTCDNCGYDCMYKDTDHKRNVVTKYCSFCGKHVINDIVRTKGKKRKYVDGEINEKNNISM